MNLENNFFGKYFFIFIITIICYLFFSGNALSIRTFYYKEGYKYGYEDKKENREYNDMKMFNIENSSKWNLHIIFYKNI